MIYKKKLQDKLLLMHDSLSVLQTYHTVTSNNQLIHQALMTIFCTCCVQYHVLMPSQLTYYKNCQMNYFWSLDSLFVLLLYCTLTPDNHQAFMNITLFVMLSLWFQTIWHDLTRSDIRDCTQSKQFGCGNLGATSGAKLNLLDHVRSCQVVSGCAWPWGGCSLRCDGPCRAVPRWATSCRAVPRHLRRQVLKEERQANEVVEGVWFLSEDQHGDSDKYNV